MLPFTRSDVREALSQAAVARGESYQRQGRVSKLEVTNSGGTIAAEVRGSRSNPYAVTVYVTRRRGAQTRITGYCDCPMGLDCKHVAAALFAALDRETAPTLAARAADTAEVARVAQWLDEVRRSVTEPAATQSEGERVAYVFSSRSLAAGPRLNVRIFVAQREMTADTLGHAPFVEPRDALIGRLLEIYASAGRGRAALAEDVVRRIVATGCAYLDDIANPALSLGPPHPARIAWELAADGTQRPTLAFDAAGTIEFPAPIAWYVVPESGVAGPVDAGIAREALQALLNGPPLGASQIADVRETLAGVLPGIALPAPLELVERMERVAPVPTLHLRGVELPGLFAQKPIDIAEFTFAYGAAIVHPRTVGRTLRALAGSESLVYVRDAFAETIAAKRLAIAGLEEDVPLRMSVGAPGQVLRYTDRLDWQWSLFVNEVVPQLRAEGWNVAIDASFSHRVVDLTDDAAWHQNITESVDGWFDLALGIDIDGKRYDLLPMLADMLQRGAEDSGASASVSDRATQTYYVSLGDETTTLALPYARVRAIVDTLAELAEPGALREGRLRLPRSRAALVDELERASGFRWDTPERLRELGERLRKVQGLQRVTVPESFRGTLRPYQRDGLDWLQFLATNDLGGLLADDMGLGKSVQTLASLLCEKEAGRLTQPALLIVPTSLVYNWCDEAARFTPTLRVLALHGPARAKTFDRIEQSDLVITTYALLVRDRIFFERTWHAVILDEAQAAKNPLSKVARAATELRSSHRLCLTGTPVENNLGDLWSLFSIALPGVLGERAQFNRVFRMPIEKRRDEARGRALAARIAPFLLRRTKEAVAPELPAKTEIVQRVELTGAQRDLYETVRVAMSERVRDEIAEHGIARSQIVILDALLKLRQVCCDPRLLPERLRKAAESAKLEMLFEMLPQAIAENRRVLLFSQFTSMLDLIASAMNARGITYVTLTGETKDRESVVKRFQAGDVSVFLISLKAGGTGLNLTAADTVIHYDPWWNPAVERQATDRAHRIGQTRPVFVYKLICAGTVEDKIVDLQTRKGELAAAIFSPEADVASGFGSDDIARLFAPIDAAIST